MGVDTFDKPYYDLWCAVIKGAIHDEDIPYFCSKTFLEHCLLLDVNPEAIIVNLPKQLQVKIKNRKKQFK